MAVGKERESDHRPNGEVGLDAYSSAKTDGARRLDNPRKLGDRLSLQVSAPHRRPVWLQIAIGIGAALVAVGIRRLMPLAPIQIPTLALVVTLAIVTTFVGIWCGITTALVGGLLSWYLFFNPDSWSLAHGAWIPLLSFVVIALVIVTTAHLYRSSEQRRYQDDLARLQLHADNSDLFAREMAHRLKNTLAIVQSIAFQTIGSDSPEAGKFANRLKALADANDLLNEHVSSPNAELGEVVEAALGPFDEGRHRFDIEAVDARLSSQQVLMLALAIHELATNASKYGALSTPGGTVTISFQQADYGLMMNWRESGGPPVKAPEEFGFGARLLRRSGVDTRLDFHPEGLNCSIGIRLS